ncbi:MAG: ABC transporter permease subunit [Planctomycetes bacterium]|nr:ABC transporter permease subunit [Planctomycetota bacterium]
MNGRGPRPRRPLGPPLHFALAAAAVGASALVLDWNLEALTSAAGFAAAVDRLAAYLAGLAAPDLSAPVLQRCALLCAETLATALLGTALGLSLGYPVALLGSRCVLLGDGPPRGPWQLPRRIVLEAARLLLDALRGVPDFLWAIVLAFFTGVNAATGVLAIGVSVAGMLGKVLSEQWDSVEPRRCEALRSTGASALQTFLYGIQPLAARPMLSFVLMRAECAVRNASVIGVVGGGGIGAALWDQYADGNWARLSTVLLFLLGLTTAADLAANLLRAQLRIDPNHPLAARRVGRLAAAARRAGALLGIGAALAGSVAVLWPALRAGAGELARVEWAYAGGFLRGLAVPDLDPAVLVAVAQHSLVPLAIACLATLGGSLAAALLAGPGSVAFQLGAHRFTGERPGPFRRTGRFAGLAAARGTALVLRGVPEVAWVVLLSVFFRQGVAPCVLAVALHSAGVLHRVFAEAIDDLPYRTLERTAAPDRARLFAYGAVPRALPAWRTYAFFQFEVNLRIGIALGIVGAGGLGERFRGNLDWREYAVASSFLWAMVLLTVLVDRTSRWLQRRRSRR